MDERAFELMAEGRRELVALQIVVRRMSREVEAIRPGAAARIFQALPATGALLPDELEWFNQHLEELSLPPA